MDDNKILELAESMFFRSTFNRKWQVDEEILIRFVRELLGTKNREQIITNMCYTLRHDYGIDKKEHDGPGGYISVGLTDEERKRLWNQMAQLYDNCIETHENKRT